MQITISEIPNPTAADLALPDESFSVESVLVLHARDNHIGYTIQPVTPYRKCYPSDAEDETSFPGEAGWTVYAAFADGQMAGRMKLKKSWNNLAYIDDICVDAAFRGQGIATRLLDCAVEWAHSHGLPGLMLETQNNNSAACRLYARCGFELCGFDTHLYKGIPAAQDEIALYWYKML